MRNVKLAPSILAADFLQLGAQVEEAIREAGAAMEGKETRFGEWASALFAVSTTASAWLVSAPRPDGSSGRSPSDGQRIAIPATVATWAIYGLASLYSHKKKRPALETFVDEALPLMLTPPHADPP